MTITEARAAHGSAAQARAPRRPRRVVAWPRSLLLLAILLSAYASLHVVLQGASWWLVGALFTALVLTATTVTRALTASRWAPGIAAAVVVVLGISVGFGGDTPWLGIFPTFETFERIAAVLDGGWLSITEQGIPATPQRGIVLLLVLMMVASALLADGAAAASSPALAASPVLGILAVPVALRPDIADPLWYLVTAILFLLLLRLGRRRASPAVIALVGIIAVGGSLLAPTFLPRVDDERSSVGGVATGINPLINLGDDLRRGEEVTAITYTTDAGAGVYLRLATLDTFSGRSWSPTLVQSNPDRTVADFPDPAGLSAEVARSVQVADITVGDISGRWLPLPYPAESVTGVTGSWFWEPSGLSARSSDSGVRGQEYDVTFLDVQPELAQINATLPTPGGDNPWLALPATMPEVIAATATEITAGGITNYDKAIALQSWFTEGEFDYSEDAPVTGGYDGTGADVIARFLEAKSGYCVHFSSTMAVMARSLGIPSRVAVGFQPGVASTSGGVTTYTVSSHDLHAWPELYFDGIGWLRFEPTPGRGVIPDYNSVPAVDDPATPGDEGASPGPTITATPGAGPIRPDEQGLGPDTGGSEAPGGNPVPLILLTILGLAVVGGLTPAVVRALIRTRRWGAIRHGRDPAAAAWAELRDTARDHGWSAPEGETPRAFAHRLAVVLRSDEEVIVGLRSNVEESAYAPPGRGVPSVDEVRAVRRAIAASVDGRARLRAVVLPVSLLTRFRWDPDA